MPLREAPYADRVVRPFFSGRLPDEGARQRLAGALGISAGNAFGLLEVIGGECAGALSLYPPGDNPPSSNDDGVEFLDQSRLEEILGKLRERPLLGGEEGVRLSLAGAQDKIAVCVEGDAIGLAKGGRPTTHILKPFIQALDGTVENELFCLRLAARLKLPVPAVDMRHGGTIPFLLVERYDRALHKDGTISRLHQEDFCQALSVPFGMPSPVDGGHSLSDRTLEIAMKSSFGVTLFAIALAAAPALADEAILRVECRKGDTGGCTADGLVSYQVPPGKYIKSGSISPTGTVVNYWYKEPRCLEAKPSASVPFPVPGTDIVASLDTAFTAHLHVESGSGMADLGKVAFVNCKYTFVLGDIPKQ